MENTHDFRPLRERQRDRTREEIQVAAFALFSERGFDDTTVAQIAERAGVAIRTFFRYFPSKEDVVFGDHAQAVDRLRAALADAPSGDPPLQRVRGAVLAVQQPGQYPERELARARLIEAVPALQARFQQLAEDFESVVADTLTDDLGSGREAAARASIIAGIVFGALRGARRAATTLPNADPAVLIDIAFAIVEHGAATHFRPESGSDV
jgi:AcrR family transcriptional regulator